MKKRVLVALLSVSVGISGPMGVPVAEASSVNPEQTTEDVTFIQEETPEQEEISGQEEPAVSEVPGETAEPETTHVPKVTYDLKLKTSGSSSGSHGEDRGASGNGEDFQIF